MILIISALLVTLSMDKFRSQEPAVATRQLSVEMPASYGRALPISEEEIAAINVSIELGRRANGVCIDVFALQLGGAR